VVALVFCLVIYMIGVVALNKTPQGTGLHPAFVPFLWLALIRRRVTDWVVFAAYLAAAAAELYFNLAGLSDSAVQSTGFVIETGLVVIAPVHAVVAFSPAAGVSSWRDARAARVADQGQPPVIDAGGTQGWQQNAGLAQWKQPDSGSGGVRAN
jgi:hypothetical protein